ncbi:MAG: hypothetical protein ACRDHP_09495 [Ktedonobacterales bacterium]
MRAMWTARRLWSLASAVCLVLLVATSLSALAARRPLPTRPGANPGTNSSASHPGTLPDGALRAWAQDGAWFQRLIYLYASGNVPIQQAALAAGASAGLRATQVARVSVAVRAAWVAMMTADPAELGRTGVAPNPAGQRAVLDGLRTTLRTVAGDRYDSLLTATETAYRQTASAAWLRARGLQTGAAGRTPNGFVSVYATSFSIPGFVNTTTGAASASDGTRPTLSLHPIPPQPLPGYVALPDAYLKYANLGWDTSIPSFYQPYYLPGVDPAHFTFDTVDIATSGGVVVDPRVPIEDVGPWNEDDNWWDATDPSTTIPSSCPISPALVSPNALANAQVDGICPGPSNWRRFAYYLLYQHVAVPFFQPSAYSPTGSYADSTAWPPNLPQYCPEASAASVNNDGAPCVGSLAGYNANAGDWLRDGTYNAPVLNQSGIDLGPNVDWYLGWQWPSSGFIQVNVSRLP